MLRNSFFTSFVFIFGYSQSVKSEEYIFSLTPPKDIPSYTLDTFSFIQEKYICETAAAIGQLASIARMNKIPERDVPKYVIDNHSFISEITPRGLGKENRAKFGYTEDFGNKEESSDEIETLRRAVESPLILDVISAIYMMPDYSKELRKSLRDLTAEDGLGDSERYKEEYIVKFMFPYMVRRQIEIECKGNSEALFKKYGYFQN